MGWKKVVDDYLTFTRREQIGVMILLGLIVGVWLTPSYFSRTSASPPKIDTSLLLAAEQAKTELEERVAGKKAYAGAPSTTELFFFDPNTLDSGGWKKLGVRDRTISTILRFRKRGGTFKEPGDLEKIYGLHPEVAARLIPYVRIAPKQPSFVPDTIVTTEIFQPKLTGYRVGIIDINSADTTAWKRLPGIGSKLAARIVLFREKLGGFYSIEQIREVYGIHDTVFQKFGVYLKNEAVTVKKININTATKEELKEHPYIKWNLANAIVEYRNVHGRFIIVEDLKKILFVNEELFLKLAPYLEL